MDPSRYKRTFANQDVRLTDDNLSDLPPPPPPQYAGKSRAKSSTWWVWLIVVLVIGAAFVLAAAYFGNKAKPSAHTNPKPAASTSPPAKQTPPPAIPTTPYSTSTFGMSFNYPTSWKVVDSGSAGVSVTSPVMTLTAADGQPQLGQISMNILKQGSLPAGFTTTSVAVLLSQKVNYSNPSTSQAAATYLSFVQYPSTNIKGGLDGIYVTGNYGYQKDQDIPASNVTSIDPLIYFNFYACTSSACPLQTRQALTVAASDWHNPDFSGPILTMVKSFSFD